MILIASAGLNWEIGFNNDLLFYAPDDLKFFKSQTIDNVVIMGRRTFESLPGQKPLKNRENIILTTDKNFKVDGATVYHNVDDLLSYIKDIEDRKVFVMGGASVYKLLLPYCNTALITQFYATKEADRFLPNLSNHPEWKLSSRSKKMEYEGLEFTFDTYERI